MVKEAIKGLEYRDVTTYSDLLCQYLDVIMCLLIPKPFGMRRGGYEVGRRALLRVEVLILVDLAGENSGEGAAYDCVTMMGEPSIG